MRHDHPGARRPAARFRISSYGGAKKQRDDCAPGTGHAQRRRVCEGAHQRRTAPRRSRSPDELTVLRPYKFSGLATAARLVGNVPLGLHATSRNTPWEYRALVSVILSLAREACANALRALR